MTITLNIPNKIHRSEHEQNSDLVYKNIDKFCRPLTEPVKSTIIIFSSYNKTNYMH